MGTTIRLSAILGITLVHGAIVMAGGHTDYHVGAPSDTFDGTASRASWIWDAGDPNPRNGYLYVRKSFSLDHPVVKASAYVSAYAFAELYINGRHVDRVPVNPDPEFQTYDHFDLTAFLHEGQNTIAALVHNPGEGLHHRLVARGGFFFQGVVTDATGTVVHIDSDSTWRVSGAQAWDAEAPQRQIHHCIGIRERFDARLACEDWAAATFDDSAWSEATEIGVPPVAPWNHIVVVERPRLQRKILEPTATWDTPDYRVFDFGKEIAAHPRFTITARRAGIEIILGTGERLNADRLPTMKDNVDFTDTYITRESRQSWQPVTWRAFRYLALQKHPDVTIDNVTAEFRSLPVTKAGLFRCSDEQLNRYWEIGRWTLQLCAQDTWMDTPWREQTQYIAGDTRYDMRYAFYGFDPDIKWLSDYNILSGAFSQRWHDQGAIRSRYPTGYHLGPETSTYIPDYQLEWVLMLQEHHLYYADDELIERVYPNLRRLLKYFEGYVSTEHGLLGRVPGWVVLDHPDTYRMDVDGENTAMNCLYYGALNAAAGLARDVTNDAPSAERWEKQAQSIKQAIQERLWSEKDHAFRDGFESERVTQQTQVYALRYGLVPEAHKDDVVRLVTSKGRSCEQSFSYWLLYTMFEAGQDQWALDYIRRHWGEQTKKDDFNGAWHENWAPGGSTSHAWCSGPTALLPEFIVGLQPLEPGWKTFRIQPHLVDLEWAEGKVSTPRGQVTASIRKITRANQNVGLVIETHVPEDTKAQLHIPVRDIATGSIFADGRTVWKDHAFVQSDGRIGYESDTDRNLVVNLGPGTYTFYILDSQP